MSRFRPRHLVLVAFASLVVAGCGSNPMQPQVSPGNSAGGAAVAGDVAVQSVVPDEIGDGPVATARILGNRGGSVTAGNFTVVVPAGAFSGQATILVHQPDPTQPLVELSIYPASKNSFRVPVTLVATLPTVDVTQLLTSQVSELDPSTGTWLPMAGEQADAGTMTVSAPLQHFSTYRVEFPAVASGGAGSSGGPDLSPGKQSTIQE